MTKDFYTVVVADDEIELLNAVCEMTPWNEIGFQLVGRAGNGWDALQLVEQLQPDLLLTDIHMNFISGLSLAKQVRELQPLTQIVFLSGYDDFEYAQKAIEYNVIRYLLKPITMEDLTRELKEIHKKITQIIDHLQPRKPQSSGWQVYLLSAMADGFACPPAESVFLMDGLITRDCAMCVIALQSRQDISYTVDIVLGKYFLSHSVYSGGRVLTLLSAESLDKLPAALDELSQAIWRVVGIRCSIGVSRIFRQLPRIHAAWREAVDAQRFAEPGTTQFISAFSGRKYDDQQNIKDISAKIDSCLRTADRNELEMQLNRELAMGESADPLLQELSLVQVLSGALNLLIENVPSENIAELWNRSGIPQIMFSEKPLQVYWRHISALFLAARDLISEQQREGVSLLCSQALEIINRDYMREELSLGSVSEMLHVSPNYLSANMKKYAGDTFISLLIRKRMEVAQKLLTNGNLRIYEVAQRCGYSDQHYFSFCFKKHFGISPAQMRRSEQEK